MITGKDPISLQVLEAFTQKQKLADIAAAFNLSLANSVNCTVNSSSCACITHSNKGVKSEGLKYDF